MYSKEESKLLRQEFWTTFGQWSLRKRKSKGKGKWLLNHTGVKGFRFKFEVQKKTPCVCLEIIDTDEVIREIRFEKLLVLKSIFDDAMNQELIWDKEFHSSPDSVVIRVYTLKQGLTIHNQSHWAEIFAFFYEKMDKLEAVFEEYKEWLE